MSDITRKQPNESSAVLAEVVPEWADSTTLDALQELADVAGQMPHDVARRAGLSTSELHSLRHLSEQPLGPVELARLLGVTSAASSGVVDRLVAHFGSLQKLLAANIDDLMDVDGVGEGRARLVREGLSRLAESSILERYV